MYYFTAMTSSAKALAVLSSLTPVQVETLGIQNSIIKDVIPLAKGLRMRKEEGIQKGTHYRILSQAKRNIKESLFTIAISAQMGLLKPEEVLKLVSAVASLPADVDPEKLPEILGLMDALADRIVML